MRRFETLAMVLAVSLSASSVLAQTPTIADAEVLFREGRALMEAGDAVRACPRFAESLRLDFAPGTLLNLAACEERLGQVASAWQHFTLLAPQLPANDDRRAYVLERVASLERRVPHLAVTMVDAPAGTTVTLDGAVLEPAALGQSRPANPGEHHVVVMTPGHADARYYATLSEGEPRWLLVAPGDLTAAETARRKSVATRRTVGWTVGGAGALSVATGVYFGARALADRSRSDALCSGTVCRDAAGVQANDDARTHSRVADVTLGVGLLAVGVAAYLVLSSQEPSQEPTARARSAIRITPFGIGGTW